MYQRVFLHKSFTIAAPFDSYNRVGQISFASDERKKRFAEYFTFK